MIADFSPCHTARIASADQCPNAASHDERGFHPQFIKNLQHGNVRKAARCTTTQCQTNLYFVIARQPMSRRQKPPSQSILSTTVYALRCASVTVAPSAVTFNTRPPLETSVLPTKAVPAWKTSTSFSKV